MRKTLILIWLASLFLYLPKGGAFSTSDGLLRPPDFSSTPALSDTKLKPVEPLKSLSVARPTTTSTSRPSGNCASWLVAAGIPNSSTVMTLINKESGCNPRSQNPTSTAYGIGQFLNSTWKTVGCVKTSDPVTQLVCMNKYILKNYGSWGGALSFHLSHNWY